MELLLLKPVLPKTPQGMGKICNIHSDLAR